METAAKTLVKPEELRIGNWVELNGKYNRVHHTNGSTLVYWEKLTDFYPNIPIQHPFSFIKDVSPIPLTPEILEKAGFIPSAVFWKHSTHHIYITVDNGFQFHVLNPDPVAVISGIHFCTHTPIGKPLFFVHQLQNGFYFLAGEEELKIEL